MSTLATLEDEPAAPPPAPRRPWWSRHIRLLGALTGVIVALAVFVVLRARSDKPTGNDISNVPVSWRRPVVSATQLSERSGVSITWVAITGDGGLVDLRFKVVDPERAAALHNAATPPAVVDEKTGLVVKDLLMSHSHSGPFKAGVTYYLIFNNPGEWVHRGSKVTVMLGNAQVEHVTVR